MTVFQLCWLAATLGIPDDFILAPKERQVTTFPPRGCPAHTCTRAGLPGAACPGVQADIAVALLAHFGDGVVEDPLRPLVHVSARLRPNPASDPLPPHTSPNALVLVYQKPYGWGTRWRPNPGLTRVSPISTAGPGLSRVARSQSPAHPLGENNVPTRPHPCGPARYCCPAPGHPCRSCRTGGNFSRQPCRPARKRARRKCGRQPT